MRWLAVALLLCWSLRPVAATEMVEIPTPPPPPPSAPKPPPRYEYRLVRHYDLIVMGAAVGVGCNGVGALFSGVMSRSWYGAIPVAGPVVYGSTTWARSLPIAMIGLASLSAAQLASIAFVIAGAKTKHRVRVEVF